MFVTSASEASEVLVPGIANLLLSPLESLANLADVLLGEAVTRQFSPKRVEPELGLAVG